MKGLSVYFSRTTTNKQRTDTGMALVLVLLLAGLWTKNVVFYKWAVPVLLLTMVIPSLLHPFALVWFGLSELAGTLISKIILSVLFYTIVFPVALFRRFSGKDNLQLRKFRKGRESVMLKRHHQFTLKDLENPF